MYVCFSCFIIIKVITKFSDPAMWHQNRDIHLSHEFRGYPISDIRSKTTTFTQKSEGETHGMKVGVVVHSLKYIFSGYSSACFTNFLSRGPMGAIRQ